MWRSRRSPSPELLLQAGAVGIVLIGAMALMMAAGLDSPHLDPPADDPPGWEQQHIADFVDVDVIDFNTEIRPILARNCLLCHGRDISTREANLRLDTRDLAIALLRDGNSRAIVPGDPDASVLLDRVSSHDPTFHMPPDDRGTLTSAEIDTIRRWISQGAPYAQHWSFMPLLRPPFPIVTKAGWPRDPLDGFILNRLESAGLTPAPEADRGTVLRRLYFDLIGLPPTPDQVRSFLADASPDAYEAVVDELLASSHFGERWGRHWLDLMRYAETHGHEFDYPIRHAWQYRDYVIRALNADVPYDEFVREHLAGDLLIDPRRNPTKGYNESIIATGWWYLSQGTHAPVDVRADEAERIDNQIDVLSKTFLGLTANCARCHDHKFDPITQADYYGLSGFMRSSHRVESMLDPGRKMATAEIELAKWKRVIDALMLQTLQVDWTHASPSVTNRILAAGEVLHGSPKADDGEVPQPFNMFDDFEGLTFDRWTIEGTAFGPRPYTQDTLGKWQGDVQARGAGFVNSHNSREGEDARGADAHIGTMLSDSFTIDRPFIHFSIGGGNHKDKTCLNLIVDGNVVRTATGHNGNRMRQDQFEVAEFVGRKARLQIVDQETGGWGNIGIDHIVFADSASMPPSYARPLDVVASEFDIAPKSLNRWVLAMSDPVLDSPAHPLHIWKRLATMERADDPESFKKNLEALIAECDRPDEPESILFDSFDFDIFTDWYPDGLAFHTGPTRTGVRRADSTEIVPSGVVHSGLIADRFEGSLRSHTFTIESPFIHYRMAGTGNARIRLIVDGYFLDEFNALLFNGMSFPVKTDGKWTTHVQRVLDKYIGHLAHIEILDEGDGWIAVDEIRFSASGTTRSYANRTLTTLFDVRQPATLEEAANALGERLRNSTRVTGTTVDWTSARMATWLLKHRLGRPRGPNPELDDFIRRYREIANAIPRPMRVLTVRDGSPQDEFIFLRGNAAAQGDIAPRQFIASLATNDQEPISFGSGRLELADRILDECNPLPARVMVNRVWHHLFGRGIVASTDDFGALGRLPTHPDLLDHLAHWFRGDGQWSTKALIRKIVLSSTYTMASTSDVQRGAEVDPTNLLLWRAPRKRLQGEAIRDSILLVSGRLDPQLFGAPVPIHITPFMSGRGHPGQSGPLDGEGRRSIYTSLRRNYQWPMMLAFDAPAPSGPVGRRSVSNVPAQALILMNDPLVTQQAQLWARRVLGDASLTDDPSRIEHMYMAAFGRPARPHELRKNRAFLDSHREQLAISDSGLSPEALEIALWANFGHVLFNVKEFIFLN